MAIATICDLRTRKIPNKLTFSASFLGIIAQSVYFGSWSGARDGVMLYAAGALCAVMGWFMGVFVMSIYKIFMRQMGHGDTKLVAAVGSLLGPWFVLLVIFYYMICFGIYSILAMAAAVPWHQMWISSELKKAGVSPMNVSLDKLEETRKKIIPVAPFIAAGTLCAVLFEIPTREFLGFMH